MSTLPKAAPKWLEKGWNVHAMMYPRAHHIISRHIGHVLIPNLREAMKKTAHESILAEQPQTIKIRERATRENVRGRREPRKIWRRSRLAGHVEALDLLFNAAGGGGEGVEIRDDVTASGTAP